MGKGAQCPRFIGKYRGCLGTLSRPRDTGMQTDYWGLSPGVNLEAFSKSGENKM